MIVSEPPSSTLRAEPKNRLGRCRALASTPPERILPELGHSEFHARASRVLVQLLCQPDRVILSVSDDGRGFDGDRVPPGHLGIGIMRERAEAVGACLEIESEPDQGTKVTVTWPGDERPTTKDE